MNNLVEELTIYLVGLSSHKKFKRTNFGVQYDDEGFILYHDNYENRLNKDFMLSIYKYSKKILNKDLFKILIVSYDYLERLKDNKSENIIILENNIGYEYNYIDRFKQSLNRLIDLLYENKNVKNSYDIFKVESILKDNSIEKIECQFDNTLWHPAIYDDISMNSIINEVEVEVEYVC